MLPKKKSTKEIVGSAHPGEDTPQKEKKKPKKAKAEATERKPRPPMKDIVRSKGFAGATCIIAGLICAFVISPLLQTKASKTTEVLTLTQDVSVGTKITEDMLKMEERGKLNLPANVLRSVTDAIGKYVSVAGTLGDVLTSYRISDSVISDDPELVALPVGKLAISASLASLEQSVSGKLRAGDIIQLFAVEEAQDNVGRYASRAVPELQRVEVLSVTNISAQNIVTGDQTPDTDRQVATIVLAVNVDQANILAGLAHSATLHAALVTRGDAKSSAAALQQQEDYFTEVAAAVEGQTAAEPSEEPATTPGEEGAEK